MEKWFSSFTVFSSIQWFFFIFVNTVVVPISVATVFEVPSGTMEMMLRASLILTGVSCIFQGWLGHRLPVMEGHSGLLWGVILNLGLSASSVGLSLTDVGGGIATGVWFACAFTLLLAVFNMIPLLHSVFSPMAMTVYLFLLTFQLNFIFFKGMLMTSETGVVEIPGTLFSVFIVLLVIILKIKGNPIVSNFSILVGLVVGWIGFALLFPEDLPTAGGAGAAAFQFFPLGPPNLELGIITVTFFAVIINLSNTITSIKAGSDLLQEETTDKKYRKSITITSIFTIFGTGFGLVPYTPFTSSIGFLESTRIFQIRPFILGGGLLTIIGLVPIFGSFLATLPITVGNAVLFVAYLQLFGTSFNSLNGYTFNSNTIFRLAAPVLIGLSLMNISPAVFTALPAVIQPFISNGLIMGVLVSLVLEKVVVWREYETVNT